MTKIETLVARAKIEYAADESNPEVSFPYSPARATNAIAKRYSYPKARLVPIVAAVYYAENGSRAPLAVPFRPDPSDPLVSLPPTTRAFRSAVRKRRDAGGRLGRWEVVAASASATLGRPVAVATVRAAYEAAGGDIDRSYTGRGTRKGAPETRADAEAELAL